ncbi:hypothetical protein [Psychrobacter sp. W2-37-MNA-CIBAN-0211]|uniref:hypothetical protein n=1 Tax=Psychrobacter sp. W2-37-MNA-CIBAN-0211 TaxID=3140443 RepID=UPI003318328E
MIDAQNVKSMVEHWLKTPPNGYFSSSYGADVRNLLLRDLSTDSANALLKKLRADIPLLSQFSDSQLKIVTEEKGHDSLYVYLLIGAIQLTLGESKIETSDQDYYDVRAQ